jgi:hypothetical protein
VDYLLSQGRKEPGIDFDKDWKILNVLIGGNNLFDCHLPESSPDDYERRLNETLTKIHQKIPRVFVNLIYIFEIGMMDAWRNGKDDPYCSRFWNVLKRSLPCMVTTDELRAKLVAYAKEYNKRMEKLSKWWNERRKKDFYVSIQPMLQHARLPDKTWVSSFDCFHPSMKANAETSAALWNSMQLPLGKKPTTMVSEFLCPDENTFLQ